ncbi:PhzF family phenazine biosynthesis protein [Candidatus Saccharibacteria bacterium]|jgi:predicted PhzF superfamily epimerase YddE/YHI9|nr:PhzF family phenazine biosynthesis protein [Candidatus Saccharibacteria bacterium]
MTIYQVDSFTNVRFKGNPAGVVILEKKLPVESMQNIALEMNVSETAFARLVKDRYFIRFFTPSNEVPICGHATLAAAHILYEVGLVENSKSISFYTKDDNFEIFKSDDGITFSLPVWPIERKEAPSFFQDIVNFPIVEYFEYQSLRHTIAILSNEEQVQSSVINLQAMKDHGVVDLSISSNSNHPGIDYVLRSFCPLIGIDEDPATGSSQCGLGPYWSKKLNKSTMKVKQLSKRSGEMIVRANQENVKISGKAITVLVMELEL